MPIALQLSAALSDRYRIERELGAGGVSPDGHRLSVDLTDADGRDVRVLNLGERTLTRATFDRDGHDATWTPDGQFLTYNSFKSGVLGIYRTGRAGPSRPNRCWHRRRSATPGTGCLTAAAWSRPPRGCTRNRDPISPW